MQQKNFDDRGFVTAGAEVCVQWLMHWPESGSSSSGSYYSNKYTSLSSRNEW